MIRPKFVLPIHYGTSPELAGTVAEFETALGNTKGTAQFLAVNPGQSVTF